MKIQKVTEDAIIFDNGNTITYDHEQDCCEHNYADFSILDDRTWNYDHDFPDELQFKFADSAGFIFGEEGYWIFIPCYSEQNGYYSLSIDIYYNDKCVLSNGMCKEELEW